MTRRNVSSTAPISCWRRARSALDKVLKASVAASCAYWVGAASGPVVPAGMMGVVPGLRGGTTPVIQRVAYSVGERVRQNRPRVLQPRLVEMDAVF